MVQEIMNYLMILGLLVLANIMLGMFYNINVKKFKFNIVKLLNGIVKSVIVVFSFCVLYYAFYQLPELTQSIGFDPQFIMFGAIVVYATKVISDLANILGVSTPTESEE